MALAIEAAPEVGPIAATAAIATGLVAANAYIWGSLLPAQIQGLMNDLDTPTVYAQENQSDVQQSAEDAAEDAEDANDATEAPVCAGAPVGRRGSPINVPKGINSPETIDGVDYSGHALDQMQGRGITPTTVQDAIDNGVPGSGYDGATTYTNDNVKVVVNPDGSVKTVIPR